MSEETQAPVKPKKAGRTPAAPTVAAAPVIYIGPTLRKYGLASGAIYKTLPDYVDGMRAELPILGSLLVSPSKLAKALARLDEPGDNAIKSAYAAVAAKFGGA